MPGTGTPDPITLRPATSAWHNLAWKVLVAVLILLLMSAGIPVSPEFVWGWIWGTLLVWGGLVVAVAASNLFSELRGLRWAWVALSVGAYGALSVPGSIPGIAGPDPSKMVDAIGPVVALTLAAHLARHDLPQALRDWVLTIGLTFYVALGVTAMWLLVSLYNLTVFTITVLLPPLILEGTLLLLRRVAFIRNNMRTQVVAVAISTALSVTVLSLTQLHESTQLFVSLIFSLVVALLVGGALLVSLFTKPMIETASSTRDGFGTNIRLGRALVELGHAAILISLVIYVFVRLVAGPVDY